MENEIEIKPKLRTYKLFKHDFKVEEYVQCKDRQKRSLFAQIRIGILPLKIETGRFSNIAVNERHCEMCSSQNIEDELHFICVCPLYDDLRNNLFASASQISQNFNFLNNTQKLIFLFQKVGRDLSKFLSHAWQRRRNMLYN